MADRSHVKESVPCETPGCDGFLKCHGGSKLRPFDGRKARVRHRRCEKCGCLVESVEFISRVINTGRSCKALSENNQHGLFG